MANVRTGSSIYIDSTGAISDTANFKAKIIIVTATSASASVILHDSQSSTVPMVRLDVASAGSQQPFDLTDAPLVFPNGITVNTLTNAVVTIIGGK